MSQASSSTPDSSSTAASTEEAVERARRMTRIRLLGLGLFVVVVLWIAYQFGLREQFKAEVLRDTIEAAGAWGFAVFVVAFLVGQVLYIPGMVFVAVAVFAWGPLAGFALGYGCGNLVVNAHFTLLRWIGGSPLAAGVPGKRWRWVQKVLDDLERHPIRSVALLRTVAFMSPPLNTALALTGLKARDHFIGTAVGLLIPVAFVAGFFDLLLS